MGHGDHGARGPGQGRTQGRTRVKEPSLAIGPWPDGPWWLLVSAALLAPVAVLVQGGAWPVAILALLAVLATPGAAIEMMLGLARAVLALSPSSRE